MLALFIIKFEFTDISKHKWKVLPYMNVDILHPDGTLSESES